MSSSLTNLVPVLTGPNYQSWAPLMTSFLMSQGQWRILQKACPILVTKKKEEVMTGEEEGSSTSPPKPKPLIKIVETTEESDIEEWEDLNSKAIGNIRLRLHHTIQYKFRDILDTGVLWVKLEKEYGNPGVIAIYMDFKAALDTKIPDNEDPSLAIDKILAHFGRLADNDVEIPKHLQTMIIMAKIPPSMETVAQMACQAESIDKLQVHRIRRSIMLAYEQKRKGGNNQQWANKLSAVKRAGDPPQFQQQQQNQQQCEGEHFQQGNNGRGRGR